MTTFMCILDALAYNIRGLTNFIPCLYWNGRSMRSADGVGHILPAAVGPLWRQRTPSLLALTHPTIHLL
ncbi:hypothetical protein BJY01DRAFT_202411 [Aspergillus pseudoustus]|uniref:Uncharacterized protein n=1 Tax=Aspergillus pseudoustus TaxID=1810923 RepID=A0ABR4KY68_9EURO